MNIDDFKRPLIISGPCSAESEQQVYETCKRLKDGGRVNVLRAGIWKPRTRPNSFEGVGAVGLPWLIKAGKELDLPVITEVANALHVEEALKAGFKNLWIGARSTVNPFTVQEIADSLRGVEGLTVMIKNPINPDLALWIGAFERFKMVGQNDLHAIHRGFSLHRKTKYRNEPMWEIPLAFKNEIPEAKMICDPSHIAGNRELLKPVSQKALDLVYDGLMIESHITPDEAWSDAAQQITPETLTELVNGLTIRSVESSNEEIEENLDSMRSEVNQVDAEIIQLIATRMGIIERIGDFKKDNSITILQPERWAEIQRLQTEKGNDLGLSDSFILQYLEVIHQESIRRQTKIMNEG